jgi:soluble lytic murein transglycosylase
VRRAAARAALALAAWAAAATPAGAAPLAGPDLPAAADAAVRWVRPPSARPSDLADRLRAARDRTDSLAAWGTGLRDTLLRPFALRRAATLHAALGDTAGADGLWATLSALRSPWQWEAARSRADLAAARGAKARADSLLERAERRDWTDAERAEWLARRAELRLALADTAAAIAFSSQMIARFPASPRAGAALRMLETLRAARRDSLSAAEQMLAADVDRFRGRNESAAGRLARAAAAGPESLAARRSLKLSRTLRDMRRFGPARDAAAAALRASVTARDSLDALLENARVLRDAGEVGPALAAYADAGARRCAGDAWWERARLLEERGEWSAARADYARAVEAGGGRAELGALRAGLMSLAAGEPGAAVGWFARGGSDGARFWLGVGLRRTRGPGGDSVLAALAARPGYTFYRCAARETLRVRGWPGARATPPPAPPEPGVRLATALGELGASDDAAFVLDRWAAGDPRLARPGAAGAAPGLGAWLEAARAAYAADRPRQAGRLLERAVARLTPEAGPVAWAVSPWLYPPAYDSLFAAWPERAAEGRLERALLQAVAWKESRFDPRARSTSDAVGLLQLKRKAVIDVARELREKPPSDAALADPALNLRYGARYLERMLARFGNDLPLALAAYNAGPTVARRWTRLRALGGDALACEEIDYPETQDYVKVILAVRQAYRELRPTAGP